MLKELNSHLMFSEGDGSAHPSSAAWPPEWTPEELFHILLGIWSADTCAPRLRRNWNPGSPTVGQCSVTAFLLQDVFGGQVCGIPLGDGHVHCYNVIGGSVYDLTCEQFLPEKLNYDRENEQRREDHFSKKEKRERYLLLRNQLIEKGLNK